MLQIMKNKRVAARAQAKFQQGLALHQHGWLAQAQEAFRQVLRIQPGHFDALHLLGLMAYQAGDLPRAVELIGRAIDSNPDNAAAHSNRGLALQQLKRLDEALESYDRALKLEPGLAEIYYNRGNVLQELARLDEALESYDRALKLMPGLAEAYSNRGNALKELKRLDEALESYECALQLKPDDAGAHFNRGNALQELNRLDEALDSYDHALRLKPDYAEAHGNRGNALKALKRLADALDSYQRSLELKPDYAEGHWNLALCCLLMGDFARGWKEYEWRWRNEKLGKLLGKKRNVTQPLWLGADSLQGKTILLYGEQGLGDTLQFCRYAKLVSDMGARVILEVPKPLMALLANLAGVAQLVAEGEELPAFDYYCPLLSLPLAFNTVLNTIPSSDGYIASDSGKVAEWKARLGERTQPRIGLAWSGSATHANDRNRSVALSDLIARLPRQFQYVSLQKETRDADKETLDSRTDILHFDEQLHDFSDTAALCQLMDLVVSVDTSVAHLAGAMGRPVWVLLPFVPDARWLLDRNDSPWYPSARLFRQDNIGDWVSAIDKVRTELLRPSRTQA